MTTTERHRPGRLSDLLSWIEDTGLARLSDQEMFSGIRIEDYVEDQAYVLRAEMPGVDPEHDIDVQVEEQLLTVTGRRREEKRDKNHQEFRYGAFTRSVPLPQGARVDQITARYVDGVLEVRLPLEEKVEPAVTRIPVQRESQSSESRESTAQESSS